MNWTPDELQALVNEHALVLFMKGTPDAPQCGFSNRASQVLQQLGEPFAARLGLHPTIRRSLRAPTPTTASR